MGLGIKTKIKRVLDKFLNTKQNNGYCIKKDYIIHKKAIYCDKRDIDEKNEGQIEIYQKALDIVKKNHFKKVLDIGCGSGWKLKKFFDNIYFLGLDLEPTYKWLKNKYPNDNWGISDFSNPPKDAFDVVICADVIEHLINPNELIDYLKAINFKYLIISTPERNALQIYQKGYTWNGPPLSYMHIREWDFKEFEDYIGEFFTIKEHYIDCLIPGSDNVKVTQVIIAVPK